MRKKARNWSESGYAPLVSFLLPFIIGSILLLVFSDFERQRYYQEQRARLTDELGVLRGNMEAEIAKTMYLTRGLSSYVAVHPQVSRTFFLSMAEELLRSRAHIKNIGLAPNNIVQFVYPEAGNEKVIGLDYRENKEQWPAVKRMMDTGATTVAGPINLVQGGRAFVARTPIYLHRGDHDAYWGLVSVVIDTQSLFSAAGLQESKRFNWAIRGRDGRGAAGEVFWGNASVFEENPVVLDVRLPEGSWQIGAIPPGGWNRPSPNAWMIWGLGTPLVLALSTLMYLWVFRQRRRYIELRAITRKAETANQAKSEFLANMSHEIRTPMNATLGFADILYDEISDPQHLEYLDTIRKNGKSLLNLLNDILDLSRIEAGKLSIGMNPCLWKPVVDEIQRIFSYIVQQKGLQWRTKIGPNIPPCIITDENRLRQILLNLAGNAVKFTEHGSVELEVTAERVGDRFRMVFSVRDTGPGIAPAMQKAIFDAFVQDQRLRMQRQEGTGLGLTISHRLARLLGGHIELKSKKGEGSEFTLILEDVAATDWTGTAGSDWIRPGHFRGQKILVVDDNVDNRSLIRHYLKGEQIKLLECSNGQEALDSLEQFAPDLILLDVHMPVMDGYTFLEHLRSRDGWQSVPVLLFTADVMEDNLKASQKLSHSGLLKKPLRKRDLIQSLLEHLSEPNRS
ncbi:MAG: response regulator [Leptospiraceae bacterium]|nr:response regulator [Leptospiraceae bacterium]